MPHRDRDWNPDGATALADPRPQVVFGFYPLVLRWFGMLPFRRTTGGGTRTRKRLTQGWYQFLSFMDRRVHLRFMNYGYAPIDPAEPTVELRPEDTNDRYFIGLYARVSGAVDLEGREVLEVGSGRGGGAWFVSRYLRPRVMTGMDFAGRAVTFCRRTYRREGLDFTVGDAERMPFPDGSFDVVLNVESSHCYSHMDRFVGEAFRVLRPGGHLLFADMRHREAIGSVREAFHRAGFRVEQEQEITPNVLRALTLDNDRKSGLIHREVPWYLKSLFRCFAGMQGTESYESFASGEWVYWRFALLKPSTVVEHSVPA